MPDSLSATGTDTIPILLDTDIGSDIDDAVALAYLLRQPRCEFLGVTTVTGEPHKRASLVDALCNAAGRTDIPIHVGVEAPLVVSQHQDKTPQYDALTDRQTWREFSKENTAIDFLRDTILARPNEITLLTIGPLTNIALLFSMYPEIPPLIKHHVMMGGWYFDREGGEWNIVCDPHAASIALSAPVPSVTAIGLEVTGQCRMNADECRRRFNAAGEPLSSVTALAEVWFKHSGESVFHDPLAAAMIFEPWLCETSSGKIVIELDPSRVFGLTTLETGGTETHHVCKTVQPDAFFKHYYEIVEGK